MPVVSGRAAFSDLPPARFWLQACVGSVPCRLVAGGGLDAPADPLRRACPSILLHQPTRSMALSTFSWLIPVQSSLIAADPEARDHARRQRFTFRDDHRGPVPKST
jgi:hypothetical protein